MDVTFFEHQPYYPISNIQGKSSFTQEYLFWDINTEISDPSITHTLSNLINTQTYQNTFSTPIEVQLKEILCIPSPYSLDIT